MIEPINQCIICRDEPKTKEDIIPKWLQNHFNLKNQSLMLWNNTTITYKRTLIPLCNKCNNEKLSRLEQRIKNGTANNTDYYLWSLKIRFLLSVKDTTLQLDIKDKAKGKLLSYEQGFIGYEFVSFVLQNFEDPGFRFNPNPFGSVFLFDNPIKDENFGLVDVAHPYWGLSISLPNSKILAVLFTDRGMVKRELEKKYKNKKGMESWLKKLSVESTNELIQMLMVKLLITQYQIENIPYRFFTIDKKMLSRPIPNKTKYKSNLKREIIVDISNTVGLGTKYGNDFYKSLIAAKFNQ